MLFHGSCVKGTKCLINISSFYRMRVVVRNPSSRQNWSSSQKLFLSLFLHLPHFPAALPCQDFNLSNLLKVMLQAQNMHSGRSLFLLHRDILIFQSDAWCSSNRKPLATYIKFSKKTETTRKLSGVQLPSSWKLNPTSTSSDVGVSSPWRHDPLPFNLSNMTTSMPMVPRTPEEQLPSQHCLSSPQKSFRCLLAFVLQLYPRAPSVTDWVKI